MNVNIYEIHTGLCYEQLILKNEIIIVKQMLTTCFTMIVKSSHCFPFPLIGRPLK